MIVCSFANTLLRKPLGDLRRTLNLMSKVEETTPSEVEVQPTTARDFATAQRLVASQRSSSPSPQASGQSVRPRARSSPPARTSRRSAFGVAADTLAANAGNRARAL